MTDTVEVNIFKDDNSVIHFKKPYIEYSSKGKVCFLTGASEVKQIKDLLPDILKQLGLRQLSFMKDLSENLRKEETKEEAPELVDFEEVCNNDYANDVSKN